MLQTVGLPLQALLVLVFLLTPAYSITPGTSTPNPKIRKPKPTQRSGRAEAVEDLLGGPLVFGLAYKDPSSLRLHFGVRPSGPSWHEETRG